MTAAEVGNPQILRALCNLLTLYYYTLKDFKQNYHGQIYAFCWSLLDQFLGSTQSFNNIKHL